MALVIDDGLGKGPKAGVNARNRLLVDSSQNVGGHFVSAKDELAFNTQSIDADAAAGDYIFYFKNDSTTHLFFVDLVRVGSVNAARWKVAVVTGTAGGTQLTPRNINLTSGKTAEATAYGSAAVTGLSESHVFATTRTQAAGVSTIPFDDLLILGTDNAFAIEYDTGTTGIAEVLMRGYFKKIDEIGS